MKFGEKVKKLRKDMKLSQGELAKKIGVSGRSVASYEAGTSYPRYKATYDALAAALGGMVVSLTVGKKKYAENESALREIGDRAEKAREALLAMIDADAEAFTPLARAYSLPKDDPNRETILEDALIRAAAAPMRIAELCCEVIELLEGCASMGSLLVLSDAASGAVLARGALEAAAINIKVNTSLMHNHNHAAALDARIGKIEEEFIPRAEAIRRSLGY